jgi:6-phosphogluconate dehydrogenase
VKPGKLNVDKKQFLDALNAATYAAFLGSFVQGLHVLSRASEENKWDVNFRDVLALWRAGCIIRSNAIADLLDEVYRSKHLDNNNLLGDSRIGEEFTRTYPGLKSVVLRAMEVDLNVPALSASLEYYKASGYTDMPPTSFEEAELDYFGEHMFDLKTEKPGKPVTGSHHFEWHPAHGVRSRGN